MSYRPQPKTRRGVFGLAALAFALAVAGLPHPVAAYHFFYIRSPLPLPTAWRAVVTPIIDNDSAIFQTTSQTAMDRWNDVATAKDMFGTATMSAVNFTGDNYLTAWGMPDDGKFEFVCDSDGSVLTKLGLSAGTLGFAPTIAAVIGGQGAIIDGYAVLNCAVAESANYNWLATMVHELGHALGLAHTPVYQGRSAPGTLEPVNAADAPTMYPYAIPGNDIATSTLEEDDKAGISELYPDTTFAAVYGTISGTVTRCGTNEAVIGAIIRAVDTTTRKTQFTRYSGYDGNTTGSYDMKVLPGTYHLILETLALNVNAMAVIGTRGAAARVDKDFATEYLSPPAEESACTEDIPDSATNVPVAASEWTDDNGGQGLFAAVTADQNFKTNPVELAFVVDDTGSMGPEIAAVRTTLTNQIERLKAVTDKPYPNTAIVTFKDSVLVRKISRDPAVLQSIVNGLTASGGGDCPEWSNDALLVAGRLLRNGGKSMLFTDADSHPTGATTAAVSALYTSKSLRMSVLLSGRCTGPAFDGPGAAHDADGMDPRDSQNPDAGDGDFATDRLPPEPTLGIESSIETNAAIARATGGMFAAIPGIKSGDVTETTRYINTGTNIAVSASIPTVGLVTPGDGPRATTIDIDIEGSTTNFQSSSVVTFAGTGITVNSRTVKSPTVITANVTIAGDAALDFRDVTVTTELGGGTVESATGVGAFNVTTTPTSPTILSVSPNSLGPGQTVDVTIKGINTNFTNASMPVFCVSTFCTSTGGHDTNVVLNAITPVDATTVIVNLTIDTDAIIGYRSVSVITGSEVARETVVGPFLIAPTAADIAALTSVTPASGSIGQTLTIDVVGANTNFVNGTSALSFSGTGITVNSTTVTSPTTASASITIDAGATPGFRDIFVTTDGESAALLNGFNVLGSVPTAQPATGLYVASVVGNLVTLRFTPPAFGLPPDNYVLEGGINPGEVLASIATNSAYPIFTFIAPTGAFYVRMHTLSGASRSGPSNEIRLYVNVPAPPSPPASLTGTVDGTSLTLSWRNTFEGGAPQSHLLDVTGAAVATLPLPLGEQFSFIGVPGGTYTLRVRSVNAGGVSAASDPVTLSFPGACSGVPVAPTSFLASRMGNLVKVDWEPPASGPAPTGFTLIVTGTFNLTIPTTGRTLQGEVPSGVYNLSVRGINSCGLGVVTAVQTIVVP